MSIGRILFLAIFLFSSSSILATSSFLEKITYDSILDLSSLTSSKLQVEQKELEESYKREVLELLNQYSGGTISYKNFEESLLETTVPSQYRDLHFKLVTAMAELNSTKTETGDIRSKLELLRDSYSWLATNLAIFIVNNF